MKSYLRASSLLFNQPLLVLPDMLDLGVRWANQTMNLNIINLNTGAAAGQPSLRSDESIALQVEQQQEQRRAGISTTGVEVLPVHGVLVSRGAHLDPCETMTSYEGLRAQLRQAVADPMVEHIVLDIDSPGVRQRARSSWLRISACLPNRSPSPAWLTLWPTAAAT